MIHPAPLYIIGGVMLAYNSVLYRSSSATGRTAEGGKVDRNIFLQVTCDLSP